MRLTTLTAPLTAALLLAACGDVAVGNGQITREPRVVPAFSEVTNATSLRVRVAVGGPRQVQVTIDRNVLAHVTARVVEGVLLIESDADLVETDGERLIDVRVPELDAVNVTGDGTIEVSGLVAGTLKATVEGAGAITLAGKLDVLEVEVSGVGHVDSSALETAEAQVTVDGAGLVSVLARNLVRVVINGAGQVRVAGNPIIRSDVFGLGEVVRE